MSNQLVAKEVILDTCKAVFREHGYSNTSLAMLAEACSMSKSHFYYYYENKEALMEAVLISELMHFNDRIFQLAYEEAFSPKKRLKKMFKRLDKAFCSENSGSLIAMTVFQVKKEEQGRFFPIIREFYNNWEKALHHIYSMKYNTAKSLKLSRSAILQIEGSLIFLLLNNDNAVFRDTTTQLLNAFAKS